MNRARQMSLLALAGVLAVAFQTPGRTHDAQRRMSAALAARLEKGLRPVDFKPRLRRGEASKRVTVLIEYEGLAATRAFAAAVRDGRGVTAASAASREAVARNRTAQQAVRAALAGLGGRELYSTQRVLNATVAVIDARQVPALRRMSGVKRVVPAPLHKLHNSTSVPHVGANRAWDSTGALGRLGLTGQGVTVAVIDTGIDYLHRNFGGDSSLYAGQDPDVANSDGVPFPTAKVVFGFDLVGDNYDANSDDPAENTPVPDDDPTDCNGHGSHVAGSVAGFGVSGGTTYTGGYDNLDASALASFDIGPGVAPEASLVALKVFGCDGSTAVTIQAIELAVDPNGDGDLSDHFDVINMSLGSSWGNPHDPSSVAADNAVEAGVIVVASAGNTSDNYFAVSSPSIGSRVISVAASADAGVSTVAVVDGTGAAHTALAAAYGPAITAPVPDPPAQIEVPSGPTGCTAANFTGFTAGNVALVDRGACNFELKTVNAEAAGASAVIIDNVVDCAAFVGGGDDTLPDPAIPTVMVSCVAGATLKGRLPTTAQIDPGRGLNLEDTVADFSSRGPARPASPSRLKPEVTAPGVAVTSTQTGYDGTLGTGSDSLTISGTSMASPHVAGTMALLRQHHPNWPLAHLKALAVNTANHNVFHFDAIGGARGPVVGSGRIGAGRLDVPAALASPVVAYGADDPDAVGIAISRDVVGTQTSTVSREIEVVNRGSRPASYGVVVRRLVDASGVAVRASPSTLTVPAHGTARVKLTVTFNPRRMLHDLEPSVADIQSGDPRHWLTAESGFVLLRSTTSSRPHLRVPYDVQPRPASRLSGAADPARSVGGAGVLRLRGPSVGNFSSRTTPAGFPVDQASLVSSHELVWQSAKTDLGTHNAWDSGDIRYLGVSSDLSQGGITSFAAFNMWKNWGSPSELEVYVCADLDQDGTGGTFGDGTDWCWISLTVDETDRHRTYLWDINGFIGDALAIYAWDFANVVPVSTLDTRLLNSDSMVIPFETSPDLWVPFVTSGTDASEAYDFSVFTVHYDDPGTALGLATDASPLFTHDPTTPAVGFLRSNAPASAFGAQSPFDVVFNGAALFVPAVNAPPGDPVRALLIHHLNPQGSRAEVVEIDTPIVTGNVLVNGDFETDANADLRPDGWTGINLRSMDRLDSTNPRNGSFAFAFKGRATAVRSLRQNINVSGPAGDAFRLQGFVDTDDARSSDSLSFNLTVFYTDGTSESLGRGVQMGLSYHSPFGVPLVVTAARPYNRVRLQVDARLTRRSSAAYLDDFTVERGEY